MFHLIPLLALTLPQLSSAYVNFTTVYQYPAGTWIENIAVQANGKLLLTLFDRPELHELDPSVPNPTPKLVHRFEGAQSLLGITEISPNKFAIIQSSQNDKLPTKPRIWSLDRSANTTGSVNGTSSGPTALLATIDGPKWLNGLTSLESGKTVLAADTMGGRVYRIDLDSGASSMILDASVVGVGVNGLRRKGKYLYWTNTFEGMFTRIEIDPVTAAPVGDKVVIAGDLQGIDDFVVLDKFAYIAEFVDHSVIRVDPEGGQTTLLAKIAGQPTSVAFGRGEGQEKTLYVVTGDLQFKVGGTILALHL
jgi:hypothetical protein